MMTRLIALIAAAAGSVAVSAQEDPLASLVAAERAFARMSVEKGQVAAFLANFADEGVGFRPAPVKMKELLGQAPPPAGPVPVLDWEPWTGNVAASGDLGYTTGPWERRPPDPAAQGQVTHGWFFSVWRRAAGGPWRVVADIGISSPSAGALRPHAFDRATENTAPASASAQDAAQQSLAAAEQALSRQATTGTAAAACRQWAADRIRLYRQGLAPIVGRDAACARVEGDAAHGSWQVLHAETSRAGDLGYAYGSYEFELARPDARKESGSFLRVCTRTTAGWKIAAEVTNASPDKK